MTNEQYYDFIQPYHNANEIMRMKLEVLNHNLYLKSSQPIHHIQVRVKEKRSIEEKLARMNYSDSVQNAKDHLLDVAGIRVICYFVDDIHNLVNALKRHGELIVIREKDYISNPKPNGYRSYHMIVGVPVYYLDTMEYFPVEIQFRTMAMDFWASMEHRICYKKQPEHREELAAAFQQYAQVLENIEEQFETYNETGRLGDVHEPEIPWWRMLAEEEERRETEKNSQRIQDVK
ncbi:MAG TPA: (p)ppGpp synthetase [Candidatus Blautia intestinigallinarum]|nr:(p)ppGpp synthetase [Candidatus Blautia intestinigallinarum]